MPPRCSRRDFSAKFSTHPPNPTDDTDQRDLTDSQNRGGPPCGRCPPAANALCDDTDQRDLTDSQASPDGISSIILMPTLFPHQTQRFLAAGWGACLAVLLWTGGLHGEDYRQGFDDETPNWIVSYDKSNIRVLNHAGQAENRLMGERSESLLLECQTEGAFVQLEHELPAARSLEELKLQVWLRASTPGAGLWLRLVFPNETDPNTGQALTTFLRGDTYLDTGKWQKLECGTTKKMLQERARQFRSALNNPNLNFRDAYVDRAILTSKLPVGKVEILLDELKLGPLVSPAAVGSPTKPDVEQTDHEDGALPVTSPNEAADSSAAEASQKPPVEFRLDRLLVEGHPFFPRIAAYHGEPLNSLKLAGLNVVWVPNYEDTETLAALREQGLWAMATPPRAVTTAGKIIDPEDVSIIPFSHRTDPILLWNLGTRIPPESQEELKSWMEQIRSADREFRRPVMVDIIGGQEKNVSRFVPMLGVSRHIHHTTFAPKTFRNWLVQKQKLARPGTFMWTWIQTEPSAACVAIRDQADNAPVVIEPEQIRLQVYAALAAGCRGIGYWKTTSFEADTPGAYERQLAIAQLNLELELLEPWLATGRVVSHIPFGATPAKQQSITRRSIDFQTSLPEVGERQAKLRERANQAKRAASLAGDLEATLIRSDYGTLLLPIWYDREAQFVPGQMAANDASIIVPPFDVSASAWEISPTGIRNLQHKPAPGGKQITLKKFDQTAAVILTSDREIIAQLRRKVETLAEPSARISVALAKAKLERVAQVDEGLQTLGVTQPDAPQILARSRQLVGFAEEALGRRDYHGARQMAADAMQIQRILQRAHWNDAVRRLSSPVSSPHTICFQTLPDHWRLVARLGESRMDNNNNLLRSGNFEDIDTMVVEKWQHTQKRIDGVRAAAELYPGAKEGRYSLRLVAVPVPGKELPAVLPQNPVTVTTPPVMVQSGQVVSVSGWVRVTSPISHTLDGALLYDNLGGPISAQRWQAASDWQRFSLIREVHQSGSFTVTMTLGGLGEIQFDDLKIIPHDPRTQPPTAPSPPLADPRNPFMSPLRLLQQIPKFPSWPSRN